MCDKCKTVQSFRLHFLQSSLLMQLLYFAVRPKNVAVQRLHPLLPKPPIGYAMVTLKLIPLTSKLSGEFKPLGATVTTATLQSHSIPAQLWPRSVHILPATSSESSTGCLLVTKNNGELPDLGQTGYEWLKMCSYGLKWSMYQVCHTCNTCIHSLLILRKELILH